MEKELARRVHLKQGVSVAGGRWRELCWQLQVLNGSEDWWEACLLPNSNPWCLCSSAAGKPNNWATRELCCFTRLCEWGFVTSVSEIAVMIVVQTNSPKLSYKEATIHLQLEFHVVWELLGWLCSACAWCSVVMGGDVSTSAIQFSSCSDVNTLCCHTKPRGHVVIPWCSLRVWECSSGWLLSGQRRVIMLSRYLCRLFPPPHLK